jgi:hypothetical protein
MISANSVAVIHRFIAGTSTSHFNTCHSSSFALAAWCAAFLVYYYAPTGAVRFFCASASGFSTIRTKIDG